MSVYDFITEHHEEMSTKLRNLLYRHRTKTIDGFYADALCGRVRGMGDKTLAEFEAVKVGAEEEMKEELTKGIL